MRMIQAWQHAQHVGVCCPQPPPRPTCIHHPHFARPLRNHVSNLGERGIRGRAGMEGKRQLHWPPMRGQPVLKPQPCVPLCLPLHRCS